MKRYLICPFCSSKLKYIVDLNFNFMCPKCIYMVYSTDLIIRRERLYINSIRIDNLFEFHVCEYKNNYHQYLFSLPKKNDEKIINVLDKIKMRLVFS